MCVQVCMEGRGPGDGYCVDVGGRGMGGGDGYCAGVWGRGMGGGGMGCFACVCVCVCVGGGGGGGGVPVRNNSIPSLVPRPRGRRESASIKLSPVSSTSGIDVAVQMLLLPALE